MEKKTPNQPIKDYEFEELKKRANENRRKRTLYENLENTNEHNFSSKMIMYVALSFSVVTTFLYFIITLLRNGNIVQHVGSIISVSLLMIFSVIFVLICLFADHPKGRIFVISAASIFTLYSGFHILTDLDIIKLPSRVVVENFYKKSISDVVNWANENDILIEQQFEYSDIVEQYKVLSQDIAPGTLIKNVKKIVVTVSEGPSPEKETNIPNMIGWDVNKVLDFVDKHFLTNVTIDFEVQNQIERDTVFKQNISSVSLKRNEEIKLVISLGKKEELDNVKMEELTDKDLFHATLFLKRNAIPYTILYSYSEKDEGIILKQSVKKGTTVSPFQEEKVILTVSKKSEVTVPDLKKMSASDITLWATENKMKVTFDEEFDDSIEKGKVISASVSQGETLTPGSSFLVTLSKGQIKMIGFTNVEDFRIWATNNEIAYNVDYQFNDSVEVGKLISSSHKEGDVIKNTDTVSLVVSQGGKTTVPSLTGKTKTEAENLCSTNHIKCSFSYSSSDKEKDTVIDQSMKSGSKVPVDTSISVTISSGK